MTARDEILAALPELRARMGRDTFSPAEIIAAVEQLGTRYPEQTLRTEIVSRLCADAPDHHARVYDDFERVGRGLYRQRRPSATGPRAGVARDPKSRDKATSGGSLDGAADLTARPVRALDAATSGGGSPATAADPHGWPWEGHVQALFATYLAANGWQLSGFADTATKGHGVDVLAHKGDRSLGAEVKGWPSRTYADPRRQGETKPTQPTLQASHWFSQAVMKGLMLLDSHAGRESLVVLPDYPRYRDLERRTRSGLRGAGVHVVFVREDGTASSETWEP